MRRSLNRSNSGSAAYCTASFSECISGISQNCRRQGIGSRLCQSSLDAARRLGFRTMQFNLVVSTNTAGIGCWQRNGFQVVGTLPGAFRHRQLGYVDALVMTQALVEAPTP